MIIVQNVKSIEFCTLRLFLWYMNYISAKLILRKRIFKQNRKIHRLWCFVLSCSVMSNSAAPRTVACQAALPIGFPRQEYWSGLTFPPAGDLLDPGIKPVSTCASCIAGGFFTCRAIREVQQALNYPPKWVQLV